VNPRFWRCAVPLTGLVLGLTLGLFYSWVIDPVQLINTYPSLLRTDYRRDWVQLVALSYIADGNLEQAHARLANLEPDDIAIAMGTLIEEYAADGRPADVMRGLTSLAQSLNVYTPAMLVYAPKETVMPASQPTPVPTKTTTFTPIPPTKPPSPSPTATRTPLPPSPTADVTLTSTSTSESTLTSATPIISNTATPTPHTATPTPVLAFQLVQKEQICKSDIPPHIEVLVEDEGRRPLDGIEVWLIWDHGADRAITGLKPALGSGYVDFQAEPGETYGLGLGELGQLLVGKLALEPCPDQDGTPLPVGSWRIVFRLSPVEDE